MSPEYLIAGRDSHDAADDATISGSYQSTRSLYVPLCIDGRGDSKEQSAARLTCVQLCGILLIKNVIFKNSLFNVTRCFLTKKVKKYILDPETKTIDEI